MTNEVIKRASWLELLFDLIFVYAVSKATHILAHAHGGHIAFEQYVTFLLVMVPIWWTWTGHTLFSTRFDSENTNQRLLTLLTMLAVVFWTSFINTDFDSNYHGYLVFYVIIRLILVAMYWNAANSNPAALPIAKRLGVGFSIGLVVAITSLFFAPPYRYIVLYLGISIEIVTPLFCRRVLKTTPVKSHHLPERFGLLTIILLGESVIMLATSIDAVGWSSKTSLLTVIGFILIATLWWSYFDLMDREILGRELGTGQRILYGHLFIYIGLSSIAVFIGYSISSKLVTTHHLLLGGFSILMLMVGFILVFGLEKIISGIEARLKLVLTSSIAALTVLPMLI